MRIFLCYAAERLLVAQQVDAALETEGHDVFFARDSIAAGTPFGRSIRNEVGASDLFILLVSPESIEPGSYCLTELGFARERWADPTGRVLPVVVAPTPPDSFPPYVQNLSALCIIGGIGAVLWRWRDQGPARPFLSVASITEVRPAVAGLPPLVLVGGNARNPLPHVDSIVELALDLDGAARAVPKGRWDPILIDAPHAAGLTSPAAGVILLTPYPAAASPG